MTDQLSLPLNTLRHAVQVIPPGSSLGILEAIRRCAGIAFQLKGELSAGQADQPSPIVGQTEFKPNNFLTPGLVP